MHIKSNIYYNFFYIFTNIYKGKVHFASKTRAVFVKFALFPHPKAGAPSRNCPK